MKNFLFLALIVLSVSAWADPVSVTLRLVDQNGVDIQGSLLNISTFWVTTGSNVSIVPGTYTVQLVPPVNGSAVHYYLHRTEEVEVTDTTTNLTFTWIMISTTVYIRDQYGNSISGSTYQSVGTGYSGIPCGQTIVMPITDESVYPTMSGSWLTGYPIKLLPGVNGSGHYESQLCRDEGIKEIYEGMDSLVFEWKTAAVSVYINDQNGELIPGSAFQIHGTGYSGLPCGQTVILPITDETVYPTMSGTWMNGYPVDLLPGVNGSGHYEWDLERVEGAQEIYEGKDSLVFEWKTVATTIYVRDQFGVIIPGSAFVMHGAGYGIPSGDSVKLPITDENVYRSMSGDWMSGFPIKILPGFHGVTYYPWLLYRDEGTMEIYEGMNASEFVWKTVETTILLKDQFGTSIPGSFICGGYAWVPYGQPITIPITDEKVYLNMKGDWIGGIPVGIIPNINEAGLHYYELVRNENSGEIYEGMNPVEFVWNCLSCDIALVNAQEEIIPSSFVRLPTIYTNQIFSNGDHVRFPVTDETVYIGLDGWMKNGYNVVLYPGGTLIGSDTFEVTGSLEFDPQFVTLGGNQYGLRCIPPTGAATGIVTADCPAENTALTGVRVDAFELGTGDLIATTLTDDNGSYIFEDLASGGYTILSYRPSDILPQQMRLL